MLTFRDTEAQARYSLQKKGKKIAFNVKNSLQEDRKKGKGI